MLILASASGLTIEERIPVSEKSSGPKTLMHFQWSSRAGFADDGELVGGFTDGVEAALVGPGGDGCSDQKLRVDNATGRVAI